MYTLIISGYNYNGKPINRVFFHLTKREAKVIASRFYNPAYMAKCSLYKSHYLFYTGR